VAYDRAPEPWRESCRAQAVRWGGATEDAAAWAARFPDLGVPQAKFAAMAARFGERFHLVSLTDEVAEYGFAGARVLQLAGLSPAEIAALDTAGDHNVSLSGAALEFMRAVNGLGLDKATRRRVANLVRDRRDLFAEGKHG
jgi:hypothetical protein